MVSILKTDKIQASHGNTIQIPTGHSVNAVDTAGIYAPGQIIQIVRTTPATTSSVTLASSPPNMIEFSSENSSYKKVKLSLEKSLRRLGIDQIDLYMPHWPNPSVLIKVIKGITKPTPNNSRKTAIKDRKKIITNLFLSSESNK